MDFSIANKDFQAIFTAVREMRKWYNRLLSVELKLPAVLQQTGKISVDLCRRLHLFELKLKTWQIVVNI